MPLLFGRAEQPWQDENLREPAKQAIGSTRAATPFGIRLGGFPATDENREAAEQS
jgi:hypothetical protein